MIKQLNRKKLKKNLINNKILIIVLLLNSCNYKHHFKKDKIPLEGTTYWIYSSFNEKESYISYSFESDLIDISYYIKNKHVIKSIYAKKHKTLSDKIKNIVLTHINCYRFLKHKRRKYKTGEVGFVLSRFDLSNKISANYINLENERNVSNEYADFIKYLRKSKLINEKW